MKEQEFKTVAALGVVDHVCCYRNLTYGGWELWVYPDDSDPASFREIYRLGNRVITARGASRIWKSLDSLVAYLMRSGIKLTAIQLDGQADLME
jgi:hypothetical protein